MLKNISEIIPFLEKSLNSTILDYTAAPLTVQGENFGSTILAVNVKVKLNCGDDVLNEIQTIKLVVKFPVTNEVLTSIFQPSLSCVKENLLYTDIVPALFQLQRECGINEDNLIDVFIRCYGARLSINSNQRFADEDALLVLENLKVKGFKSGKRDQGFNKSQTESILENLAKFHALPVALRRHRPDVFDRKVRPYLQRINIYEADDKDHKIMRSLYTSVDKVQGLDANLKCKIRETLKECSDWRNRNIAENDSPYTGISHCDLWINNILFSCDSAEHINKVKFIDYQLMAYDSFANDLIFFLFSSVNESVRKEHIKHFIQHYHKHLYKTFALLKCPLGDYTFDKCHLILTAIVSQIAPRNFIYQSEHQLSENIFLFRLKCRTLCQQNNICGKLCFCCSIQSEMRHKLVNFFLKFIPSMLQRLEHVRRGITQ